jgi:DNA primase
MVAGRIRDEDIAAVRERSPIDEVVGEYLQLRNAGGGSLKGLCPFHDEKTPSFNVTPARGLFYCLAGETRVLTWKGVKPIRELAGGTHRILAPNAADADPQRHQQADIHDCRAPLVRTVGENADIQPGSHNE